MVFCYDSQSYCSAIIILHYKWEKRFKKTELPVLVHPAGKQQSCFGFGLWFCPCQPEGPHLLGDFWVTEKILASSWNFNDRPSCLIHYSYLAFGSLSVIQGSIFLIASSWLQKVVQLGRSYINLFCSKSLWGWGIGLCSLLLSCPSSMNSPSSCDLFRYRMADSEKAVLYLKTMLSDLRLLLFTLSRLRPGLPLEGGSPYLCMYCLCLPCFFSRSALGPLYIVTQWD